MMRPHTTQRVAGLAALAIALGLGVTACAPPGAAGGEAQQDVRDEIELQADETAEGFDLDALVEAAQQEGPITIYDETGKVTQIAEAFTEKYGIEAQGVKIETNSIDKVKRESESGNVIADVLTVAEPPTFYAELLKDGILTNWVPGDVYDKLPENARYPYLESQAKFLWTYNSEAYGDTCPVNNIWELTEEEWAGKVALPDPEARPQYTTMWNQAARNHAGEWEQAYEDYYHEKLETDEETAFHEWLKRFAQNDPAIFKSDEEVSEAVGSPGQDAPPIGQLADAKYRNNTDKGFHLAPCEGLEPFVGSPLPRAMGYVTKTESPNAAKLYIHFASGQEGMELLMPDGKLSFNPDVKPQSDDYGLNDLQDEVQPFDTAYLEDDYRNTVTWQDFWRSYR